ncbi:hypothetical protein [Legionella bononiensis]|uniref:Substrate of the Dot/Icm secretion system n=1 Tax=Legionella bononiensis TaxID=2793102 RepID=A0ABS1WCN0_9GAMM|nr:hypothetical protein [Legionella bononiensis]MBL7478978.1 hypothetical protein [Legionella bononiensis]MBL7527110.1 hypothetical protein [Legionella bononiensis]MBL7562079.1 hypothetical protein [Legionella bononiensis]
MSNRSLNLIYSSKTNKPSNFFSKIKLMNNIVLKFKKEDIINDFSSDDETEIGRSDSYAVFPELVQQVKQQHQITLDDFRTSLARRGISDRTFQNKILSLILQSKAGIQFGLGSAFNALFTDSQHQFYLTADYNLSIEVKNNQRVKLIYSAGWRDITKTTTEPELTARTEVDITPNRVALDKCIITQISDSPEAKNAFAYLESNQVNIVQKIILFLMNYFNLNSDIEIENVYYDKTPWNLNTRRYESVVQNDELNEWDESEDDAPSADGLTPTLTSH